jgi:hypothetical protein
MPTTSGEPLARRDDHVGLVARDDGDGVGAHDAAQRLARGLEERGRAGVELAMDQVRDDLGVRVGEELHALRLELGAHGHVVLDDAVVHHRDGPRRRAGGR